MPSALFPGTTAAATSPHASPCEEGDRLSKPTMTELLEDSESLTESDSESEIRDIEISSVSFHESENSD